MVNNWSPSSLTSWGQPTGHSIVGYWNAAVTLSGQTVTAKNLSYNGTLGASASTSFGLQVSRPSSDTQIPASYACTSP
jgi:hypothetical protein